MSRSLRRSSVWKASSKRAGLKTDVFIVHCHSACTDRANWGNEIRLTKKSFDLRKAPFAGGFFPGDYEGLGTDGIDFLPFFSVGIRLQGNDLGVNQPQIVALATVAENTQPPVSLADDDTALFITPRKLGQLLGQAPDLAPAGH